MGGSFESLTMNGQTPLRNPLYAFLASFKVIFSPA